MGLFDRLKKSINDVSVETSIRLAAASKEESKRYLPFAQKSVSRTRQDIKTWNTALDTMRAEEPKSWPLQLLLNETAVDALLTAQMENRKQQVFSVGFSLKSIKGEKDEEQTAILKNLAAYRSLTSIALDSLYYGYNVVELNITKSADGLSGMETTLIPRTNIVPQTGLFYPDYSDDKNTKYREMPEYGTYVLEFNSGNLGLINKAVPHVLFKRFAQSCWSELCEIYGIPPRVMKTNTQDTTMLNRAEKMMQDMGTAAWFIIDETESFEWATGTQTDGDVYKNLISLSNNEISLLISGAVIGQDTENGSRSKDESGQEMLWQLVQSDLAMLEEAWNTIILPSFVTLGILKPGLRFEFDPSEDLTELWNRTIASLQYFNVDGDWIKEKFGVEITGERAALTAGDPETDATKKGKLSASDFFD